MEPSPPRGADIPHAGAKAIAVLVASAAIAAAFVVYVLSARGTFERTQSLVLMAEDGQSFFMQPYMTWAYDIDIQDVHPPPGRIWLRTDLKGLVGWHKEIPGE